METTRKWRKSHNFTHQRITKWVAFLLLCSLFVTTIPHPLSAQEDRAPVISTSQIEPTPVAPDSDQSQDGQSTVSAGQTIYLPIISQGNVARAANLDFDALDFDEAVDNTNVEVLDEDVLENQEDLSTYDLADLDQLRAAFGGTDGQIDNSEDYRALGYPDARKVVRNSRGYLYVAYRKKLNSRYRIYVAESTNDGATWQPLGNKPVEGVGDYTQRVPALAIDDQDRLHLVWYGNDAENGNPENTSNEREIKYIRSTPTTGTTIQWTTWRNLYDGQGYSGGRLWQEHPTITVWSDTIHVVWESAERGLGEIKYLVSSDGGDTWSNVVTVQPSEQLYFSRPTLQVVPVNDVTANGNPVLFLVAYGTKAGRARLYYSRSDNGGITWSKWRSVAATKADQRHASLALDKDGKVHIVWREAKRRWTILRYRVYDPEKRRGKGGWAGGTQTVASVRKQCLYFPSIAIGSDDRAWVVWTQSSDCGSVPSDDPTTGQIFLATSSLNQKRWTKPAAITTGGEHLYASLGRIDPPATNRDQIDVVWLDRSTSPVDGDGDVTCVAESCVLRHMTLSEN